MNELNSRVLALSWWKSHLFPHITEGSYQNSHWNQ